MLRLNSIPGFNGKRPIGPPRVEPKLAACATSIWLLNDRALQANDYLRLNPLAFGATTTEPKWRDRMGGGACLAFDGGDQVGSVVSGAPSAYPFWMATSFVSDNGGPATGVAVCNSSAGTQRASLGLSSSAAQYSIRVTDAGTNVSVAGPAIAPGQLVHLAAISRAGNDHALWMNGQRTTSTGNVGSTFTGFDEGTIGAFVSTGAFTNRFTGGIYWAAFGTLDPGDDFFNALTRNPWAFLHARNSSMLWLNAAAGGTIYAADIAESGSAADTFAGSLVLVGAFSESGSAADTAAAALVLGGAIAESGGAADTVGTGGAAQSGSMAETGSAVDSIAAALQLGAALAESAAAVDAAGAFVLLSGTVAEVVSLADLVGSGVTVTGEASILRTRFVPPRMRERAVAPIRTHYVTKTRTRVVTLH